MAGCVKPWPGTFTNDEYTDMVLLYGEAHANAAQARRLYAERFPQRRLPSISVFKRTVMRLKIDGTFGVQPIRPRPVCGNEATVQQVSEYFAEYPRNSLRRAATDLGLKRNSIATILKERREQQTNNTQPRPSIDLEKLVQYCRRIVDSEQQKRHVVKAEPEYCRTAADSEQTRPQFAEESDYCSGENDIKLENTHFVKVEPAE